MSLTVTQRPSTTMFGNTSKWNAAKNPIVYKMRREDFALTSISAGSPNVTVVISGNVTASILVGHTVIILTTDLTQQRTGVVTSSTFAAGNTTVVFLNSGANIGSIGTGYLNNLSRVNYRVRVGVYNTANTLLSTLEYSPDRIGNLIIDVSTPLLNNISVDNVADYVTGFTTNNETTAYVKFYIRYTEVWTGSAESETNDTANQFFAVYGARQIGELYGGNFFDYVCYEDANPVAKFLTKFAPPSIWRGYPFSIHIITSDNATTNSNFVGIYQTITNSFISSFSPTKVNNSGKLIRLSPNNALAIPSNAEYLYLTYNNTIENLSEDFYCKIKNPCSNPIMLWWRNSLGGDAFWMFEVNQSYSYRYDNGRKAKRYVLFASNLRLDEFDAINELNTLGEVYDTAYTELTTSINKSQARIGSQVYMMDSIGKKTGVIVIPTEVSTKTKFSKHKIQITIELPEIY